MDIINGFISGAAGMALCHSADTMKTWIQTSNRVSKPTIRSLYRGFSIPFVCAGIEKGIVFSVYRDNIFGLPTWGAGALAGFCSTPFVTFYERLKIYKQCYNVYPTSGYLKGLMSTYTREVPGFAIYFSNYEYWKNRLYTAKDKNISITGSFVIGGLSGLIAWVFICPQDRIKTIMQSGNNITYREAYSQIPSPKLINSYSAFKYIFLKSFLFHAGTFSVMEMLLSLQRS